ncbi:MFS transporter [Acrocarpospora sp. B8E8]|uniref:MFS transporter n=1 Tax=Acrocarpospora sp. B8E8 TaxID=3153572 RepID=UPI00325F5A02
MTRTVNRGRLPRLQRILSAAGLPMLRGYRTVIVAVLIDGIGAGMFLPFSIIFFDNSTDLSLSWIGTALTIATLLAMPAALLAGSGIDRWGPASILVANNVVAALGYLSYFWVHDVITLIAASAIVLIADQLYWSAWPVYVADISQGQDLDRWFALTNVVRNVSVGLGGLLGGVIASSYGPSSLSWLLGVNIVTCFVAGAMFSSKRIAGARPRRDPSSRSKERPRWSDALRDRPFLLMAASQAVTSFAWLIPHMALPVYLIVVEKVSPWVASAGLTLNMLISIALQTVVTRLTAGFSRTVVIAGATGLMTSGVAAIAVSGHTQGLTQTSLILLGVTLLTLGQLVHGPAVSALVTLHAPKAARGRYMSIFQLAWACSSVGGPVLVGSLVELDATLLWATFALMILFGGAGYIWALHVKSSTHNRTEQFQATAKGTTPP